MIRFDLGGGTTASFDDTALVDTTRGMVPADQVVQGDWLRNLSGLPRLQVVATPVVE